MGHYVLAALIYEVVEPVVELMCVRDISSCAMKYNCVYSGSNEGS
jgi:hypothetical protein